MAKRKHLGKMIALTTAAMLLMAITACGGENPTLSRRLIRIP